jgi:hypothetical protein
MAENLADVIRGDVPLAKAIFGDERKRRLIGRLQQDGWPIFEVCGKRCAFPDALAATIAQMRQASRPKQRPRGWRRQTR